MLAKILIIIISIFYSIGVQAIQKPFGLELGVATLDDVKRMYKIKKEEHDKECSLYVLDLSSLPDNKLQEADVSCYMDDNIVIKMSLTYSSDEFDNMFLYLSDKYKLSYYTPPERRTFENTIQATFRDGDQTISLMAIKDENKLYVSYSIKERFEKNRKPKSSKQ